MGQREAQNPHQELEEEFAFPFDAATSARVPRAVHAHVTHSFAMHMGEGGKGGGHDSDSSLNCPGRAASPLPRPPEMRSRQEGLQERLQPTSVPPSKVPPCVCGILHTPPRQVVSDHDTRGFVLELRGAGPVCGLPARANTRGNSSLSLRHSLARPAAPVCKRRPDGPTCVVVGQPRRGRPASACTCHARNVQGPGAGVAAVTTNSEAKSLLLGVMCCCWSSICRCRSAPLFFSS